MTRFCILLAGDCCIRCARFVYNEATPHAALHQPALAALTSLQESKRP